MGHNGLRGRVALVTGTGRRQGIGAAIARALADRGADVFLTWWQAYDRTMPWGDDADGPGALAAEIRALGVRCERLEIDLSVADAPSLLLDAAESALGPLSILINNATHSTRDGWERLDAATL